MFSMLSAIVLPLGVASAGEKPNSTLSAPAPSAANSEIGQLKEILIAQQHQIDELRRELARQKATVEALAPPAPSTVVNGTEVASMAPIVPSAAVASVASPIGPPILNSAAFTVGVPSQSAAPTAANVTPDLGKRVEQVENSIKGLGGFVFSGDFRYRFDLQARSGNDVAGPLQNARSRYRVRLNVDKVLDPAFRFHLQLSTGPYATETTNDQDFAGFGVKAPFSIAEAWVAYAPNKHFSFRVGRMEETFADNARFLWDDDIRLNGFEEVVGTQIGSGHGIFSRVDFRAGEYILTNPNVAVLSATSPFVAAGYRTGTRIGAANLFHPGVTLKGNIDENWSHQITGDVQIYRNPNQIQLGSTAAGFPVVASNAIGLALSGPTGQTGNATTTPGGAIYTAPDFQIARIDYRLDNKAMFSFRGKPVPGFFDFQASRNTGASTLRDAFAVSASLGATRKFGDVRGLYQYIVKDANALISQFTDDDLGTGTGVNIAVHALRVDIGLTRFLQWQNLLFIQHEKSVSNPQELLFLPIQRGAGTTFRYLGQLAFTF